MKQMSMTSEKGYRDLTETNKTDNNDWLVVANNTFDIETL